MLGGEDNFDVTESRRLRAPGGSKPTGRVRIESKEETPDLPQVQWVCFTVSGVLGLVPEETGALRCECVSCLWDLGIQRKREPCRVSAFQGLGWSGQDQGETGALLSERVCFKFLEGWRKPCRRASGGGMGRLGRRGICSASGRWAMVFWCHSTFQVNCKWNPFLLTIFERLLVRSYFLLRGKLYDYN